MAIDKMPSNENNLKRGSLLARLPTEAASACSVRPGSAAIVAALGLFSATTLTAVFESPSGFLAVTGKLEIQAMIPAMIATFIFLISIDIPQLIERIRPTIVLNSAYLQPSSTNACSFNDIVLDSY
ncbi:MAG: hypothetical protein ACU83N_01865 [Gammaproteobacteria bacterium]